MIGINTFIFTESGGSLGIGFAIPINVAVARGRARSSSTARSGRSGSGSRVMDVTPYLAAYYGLRDAAAGSSCTSWRTEAPPTGPASRWETSSCAVNGEEVSRRRRPQRLIFGAAVGDVITLQVEREGKQREMRMRLEAEPQRQGGQQG